MCPWNTNAHLSLPAPPLFLILGAQLRRHSPHLISCLDTCLLHTTGIQDRCSCFADLCARLFPSSALFGWCSSPLRTILTHLFVPESSSLPRPVSCMELPCTCLSFFPRTNGVVCWGRGVVDNNLGKETRRTHNTWDIFYTMD